MRHFTRNLAVSLAVLAIAAVLAVAAADKPDKKAPGRRVKEALRKRRSQPPRVLVVQFDHISAESFVETLEALGEGRDVGRLLASAALAVNEQANAVVILARPDVAEMLEVIAEGLDRPSEFHERMRQRERQERAERMKMEIIERKARQDLRPKKAGPRQASPGCKDCPMMRGMGPGPRMPKGPRQAGPHMRPGHKMDRRDKDHARKADRREKDRDRGMDRRAEELKEVSRKLDHRGKELDQVRRKLGRRAEEIEKAGRTLDHREKELNQLRRRLGQRAEKLEKLSRSLRADRKEELPRYNRLNSQLPAPGVSPQYRRRA